MHQHLVEAAKAIAWSSTRWSTLGRSLRICASGQNGFHEVRECTTVFFWSLDRQVGMEVHLDDVHGFGPDPQVQKFKEDLAAHIWSRDGGVHHEGAEYDNLKLLHKRLNGAMTIEINPKYLDAVLELLGLEGEGRAHSERSWTQGTAHDWRTAGFV